MFKKSITNKLEKYVKRYFEKHPNIKLVAVAGSVGKTSTKLAVATVLSERYKVRLHEGNHNTHLSAPLAILGINYPGNPRSFWQWHKVFKAARRRINSSSAEEPEVIIQELGTDHPGDIAKFGEYLLPDIALVTAITPEHMEFFGSIEAVADEELEVVKFAKSSLINISDVRLEFTEKVKNYITNYYGTGGNNQYEFIPHDFNINVGYIGEVKSLELGSFPANVKVFGEHSLRPIAGAIAVASKMGLTANEIVSGLSKISPVSGRMNILAGVDESVLIDDTYNASPAAVEASLNTFYKINAPSRILVLGSMNELGELSAAEHQKIGSLCNGSLTDWVITVGDDASKYIAPIARQRGCQVYEAKNAIDAGIFVRSNMQKGALILCKGSQGNVYLEETVKILLKDQSDAEKLVRQDKNWQTIKREFFESFTNIEDDEV